MQSGDASSGWQGRLALLWGWSAVLLVLIAIIGAVSGSAILGGVGLTCVGLSILVWASVTLKCDDLLERTGPTLWLIAGLGMLVLGVLWLAA